MHTEGNRNKFNGPALESLPAAQPKEDQQQRVTPLLVLDPSSLVAVI